MDHDHKRVIRHNKQKKQHLPGSFTREKRDMAASVNRFWPLNDLFRSF